MWGKMDPNSLYDPRHTTGLSPLYGKPKHRLSLRALFVWLGFLLLTLAGALVFLAIVVG